MGIFDRSEDTRLHQNYEVQKKTRQNLSNIQNVDAFATSKTSKYSISHWFCIHFRLLGFVAKRLCDRLANSVLLSVLKMWNMRCSKVNTCILRQAGRICGEASGFHRKCKRFASGRRCVRLLGVHRCKRFASGRRCVRLFCAYSPQPRRNGRSPGRSAAALSKSTAFYVARRAC